jgi:hypothetical protein
MALPYGMQDSHLQQIITKTQNALDAMAQLQSAVAQHGQALPQANRSDSGQILGNHIDTWTGHHATCTQNLAALNEKASALLRTNRNAEEQGTQQAQAQSA